MSDDGASYYSAAPTPPAPPAGLGYPPQAQYGQAPYQQAPYQQAPYQPWGGGSSYPPQPPSHQRAWIIAGVCAVVVVVVALIAAAVGLFVHNTSGAKRAANTYLADLQNGQYPQAYSMLCASDQATASEQQFAAAKTAIHPVSYSIESVSLRTVNSSTVAFVDYQVIENDGSSAPSQLGLIKSGGSWQVCHALFGSTQYLQH